MIVADLLAQALSASAIAIALCSLLVTYAHSRAIRRIETREHEWQVSDRQSAWIQALPQANASGSKGTIRLKNTGRADAREVEWRTEPVGVGLYFEQKRTSLAVIRPGEYYDLGYLLSSHQMDATFVVTWTDDLGEHETERILSL